MAMDMKTIGAYLNGLVPPRPAEVERMEAEAREKRFPIIGPVCGQLCYLLARMADARRIFELGSGFGYSTYWFARAVRENGGGEVHHTVWDEDLSRRAKASLEALGFGDLVRFHVCEAVSALRDAPGPFDAIFCDIDKHGYPEALEVSKPKLKPGGVLIFDNMLWGGCVFEEGEGTPDTQGIRETTRRLFEDPEFISTFVPIRDGMVVAWKRPQAETHEMA